MPDIARFLDQLGLSQYSQAFHDNAVDHALLPELGDADLRELGVEALGHRKKILRAAARITSADPEPESRAQRRQLTLMFADLADSTRLSDHLELEAYNALIRAYQDTATRAIEAHGGYVAKYIGDGLLAYFGYPRSHEDDAARAIRAGKALLEQVSRRDAGAKDARLSVRVGIETGPVVVGEIIGEASAQEHAVVGKTPNLAARLQALAEPGTVVVGPVAHRLAATAAEFHPLGEHELKGFEAPVPAWRVDALRSLADAIEDDDTSGITPLIGRRRELGALASAFARMRSGEELIVHLSGEAGIGKSRLVQEFLAQIGGTATVLAGNCASHGGSTAFFPFINLLRRWFSETGGPAASGDGWMDRLTDSGLDADRHIPYLLKLLDVSHPAVSGVEPDLIGVRTQEALTRFIAGHGRVRPTVLFINDLQWIDERSATLLDALARGGDRQGVLVLATFRRRYAPPWREVAGVEEIALAPLSAEESLNLFQSRAEGLAGGDLAGIVERAGGNPLFLEELARHMALASGSAGDGSGTAIPETLAGLLMQRVDALPPRARRVAEAAAVAGRRFDARLLGERAEAALTELQAGGVVLPDPGGGDAYRFQHALVQDAIHDSLLEADRRRLHNDVGTRLAELYAGRETEVAEDLAWHFEAAGDARAAVRYAYLAGNKALDLFALHDAQTWYGKCLTLAPPEGTPEDDLLFARTVVNQTQVLCWNGDFPAMYGLAQRHLPRIRALGAIEEVSRALTWIGEGYMHVGRYEESRATLEQALEGGRALENEICIGYASCELLWLDTITAEGAAYNSLPDRSSGLEALADRVGDRLLATFAHYARWVHATQCGRVGDALETARRLRAFGEQSNYPPAECWGACLEADGHARAGNAAEADLAVRAGREAAACGFDLLMADLALGMTLVTTGRAGEGLALLEKAPWRTDRIGALYFAYAGDVACGRALAATGRVDDGLGWLRDGIAWFDGIGNRRAACMSALELARILIDNTSQPDPRKGLRRRLGALFASNSGPVDEARACLDRVLADHQALSMHDTGAGALVLRARLAERDHDPAAARAALAEALKLASTLGWLPLEQQINTEIRRLGAN